jgi:actin related protein 2/3 complex subunit 1A/1B
LCDSPIICHSFNKDKTRVAVSPNDNTVKIFLKSGNKWECEHTFTEHTEVVTGIDWAPESNLITTCAADRNAYVWVNQDGKWKPTLVILRINRAATSVKWSPKEDKFAVASGARLISICYFEKENNWWVSKHIKKPIRSTVLSVDWHPNNVLLAAGSTDFKARVFSTYIKEIESKPEATPWGKKMPFGALMAELSNGNGGWVHCVAFSPSGNKMAWVGHDSSVSVAVAGAETPAVIKLKELPLLSCIWLTEGSLLSAGHNFTPDVFTHDDNNKLTFLAKLDEAKNKGGDEDETMSAMERFRNLDKRATVGKEAKSETTHENAITQLSRYHGDGETVTSVSSSGLDGKVVIWNMKSLEQSIAELKIY